MMYVYNEVANFERSLNDEHAKPSLFEGGLI